MVPLAEAAVAAAAVPPELELALPAVAPTTASGLPVTCGEAVPLAGLALLELAALVSVASYTRTVPLDLKRKEYGEVGVSLALP